DLEAFALLVIGMVYEALGDYPEALKHHLDTLKLCRITGNKANEGAALLNIGIVFRKIGELGKAKEHFEDAYLIFKSLKIKLLEAAALYNIGTSYRDFEEYSKAYEFLNSSLNLQKEIGHAQGQGACYISIGHVLTRLKKFSLAEENIRESIELARAFARKNYECNGMLALGECFIEQHNERQAITILEEANGEAEIYGAKDVRYKILLALSRAHELKGDFRKAFGFYKQGTAIRDELINEESTRKNKGMMILHEVETAKREREIALAEKERAEQSERFKEQFLANMSHEIRTPMNAIVGLVDLVSRTPLNPLQKKYLGAIRQSTDNLLSIIQDILDFSKIEAGQIQLEEINFSIHETLEDIYSSLRFKAAEKNNVLQYNRNNAIPDTVCGDPVRLKQILLNLVGNSIKFTEEGSINIDAQVLDSAEENIRIKFSVTDTGIGIAEDKLGDIFKSFVQASSSTTRKYGGTGLGLSISKNLVEMQHGNIEVISEVGKGTIFSFIIPYRSALPVTAMEPVTGTNGQGPEESLLIGCRVLVAEDNKFNQLVVVDSLQSFIPSVVITVVENGKLVIEKLQEAMFDILLLDLQMPEMDGYETVEYVRKKLAAPQKDIPIVALTANATQTEKDKCLKSGMNGYLSKPFRIDDLMEQMRKVIVNPKI
ncbi:MAG TPA: ATP-binding protein, partial [Chitinophagales bacterium]|nr:ATP-binding protein [Chitinophagales bacterium]